MIKLFSRVIPVLSLFVIALPAYALDASFFGPIMPKECNCPGAAPDFGCVLQVAQNVLNIGIGVAVIAVVFFIAWAGFQLITNGSNPKGREAAKNRMLNAILGLVLILGSWLLVDTIMKFFYNENAGFGPWKSIIATSGGSKCVTPTVPGSLAEDVVTILHPGTSANTGTTATGQSGTGGTVPDGVFDYDDGIKPQMASASGPLNSLLTCMAGRLPKGVGKISSISDSDIQSGKKTFAQCAASGCQHTKHSCHYGGNSCVGSSYAVDFGDEQNATVLKNTALACGATWTGFEGNHIHISVGKACGCN